jgi:hypothetical protein
MDEEQILKQLSGLTIEQRVDALKFCAIKGNEIADPFNTVGINIKKLTPQELQIIDKFPLDFQLFVKEVGLIYVGTNDYAALAVIFPDASLESFDFSDEDLPFYDYSYGFWGFDKNFYTTHLPVVTWPCSYHSAGYDLSKTPHEFVVFSDPDFSDLNIRSFLEFVEHEFVYNPNLFALFKEAHSKNFST